MTQKYYKKAHRDIIENGVVWDMPPLLIVKPHEIKTCWVHFFKLRTFNWIPEAMIDKDWKPDCPHCGTTLYRNGHSKPPRLVFDQNENYWLNSPNKYICRTCEDYTRDSTTLHPRVKIL